VDVQARYEEIANDLAARHADVQSGQMFGMPVVKCGTKAAFGIWEDALVFKLTDEAARERSLALDGAERFDPMGGRPMKEWVVVPAAHADRWPELAEAAVTHLAG
jgi:hypothetical protein